MHLLRRAETRAALLMLFILAGMSLFQVHRVRAQSAQQGISLYDLGDQKVSLTSWNFSGDFAVYAGAFESVTVTNYGYCFVGPNDPRAGTAHAGGVFWYAELQAHPPTQNGYTFDGDFSGGRGSNVTGHVTVTTNGDQSNPSTHVDVSLSGSDLSFYSDNTLKVCLLGSS
jgi:hypothetical protein